MLHGICLNAVMPHAVITLNAQYVFKHMCSYYPIKIADFALCDENHLLFAFTCIANLLCSLLMISQKHEHEQNNLWESFMTEIKRIEIHTST